MYFRLTPTLMFCVLLVAKLRPFFGAGPLWFMQSDTSACSENWWTNLLYLNNFIPENPGEVYALKFRYYSQNEWHEYLCRLVKNGHE